MHWKVKLSSIATAILGVLLLLLGVLYNKSHTHQSDIPTQRHEVRNDTFGLEITETKVINDKRNGIDGAIIHSQVRNMADRPVECFVLKWTVEYQNARKIVLIGIYDDIANLNKLQSKQFAHMASMGFVPSKSNPVSRVIPSVDFVCFFKGECVGPNTVKQAKYLADRRRSIEIYRRSLLELLNAKGFEAVKKALSY